MGYYAKVKNKIVEKVISAKIEFFETFIDDSPGEWIKTSYNTRGGVHYQPDSNIPSEDQSKSLRKNFAGIGYTYDKDKDAFIPPKPTFNTELGTITFNSWVLNESTCLWEPPIPMPTDTLPENHYYIWNESITNWDSKII
jgi:hypothetical protein